MNKDDHRKITQFTTKYFEHLFTSEFIKLLKEKGSLIAEGSKKEDEGVFTRKMNWHFYRAENSPYLKPFLFGGIHPSSRKRFIEHATILTEKVNTNNNVKSIFLLAGRIIHHIQDMSTPAHVIPIYHGPSLNPLHSFSIKDGFEEFSKSNIEKYLPGVQNLINDNKDYDRNLKESNGTMISLYDLVAKRTLDYLESDNARFKAKVNGVEKTVTPDLFWKKFDPTKLNNDKKNGWGSYGLFGKGTGEKCYFGKSCTKEDNEDNKDSYSISFSDYEHIYTHLLKQMMVDTLTVLLYVEKHILKLS